METCGRALGCCIVAERILETGTLLEEVERQASCDAAGAPVESLAADCEQAAVEANVLRHELAGRLRRAAPTAEQGGCGEQCLLIRLANKLETNG